MSHEIIRREIANLNSCLLPGVRMLSRYAFGYDCGESPKADDGTPVPIDTYINNGLCHAYALLLQTRLKELGVYSHLVGSPTHVWVESGGEWYDSAGTPETNWPHDELFDYDNRDILLREFPFLYEGMLTLSSALLMTPEGRSWANLADNILEV